MPSLPMAAKTASKKAWEKCMANNILRKPKVNMFEGEQPDTESEDEDFNPMAFSFVSHGTSWTQAQQPPADNITPAINTFDSLETDGDDSEIDNALEQLHRWAQSSRDEAEVVTTVQDCIVEEAQGESAHHV